MSKRKKKSGLDIDKLYPRPWYVSDGRYICAANSELVADLFEDSPSQASAIGERLVRAYNDLEIKPLYVIAEVSGGVLQHIHFSRKPAGYDGYHVLDRDNIEAGDKCTIPDDVLAACGVDLDAEG